MGLERGQRRAGGWLLSPALVALAVTTLVPLAFAAILSFTRYDLLSDPEFAGLDNYIALFTDPRFAQAIGNTLYFAVGQVVIGVVVALLVAMLFNRRLYGGTAMRTLVYLPQAMSYVTVALLWSFLYDPYVGPINQLLRSLGIGQVNFLTDPNLAMPSIMALSLWRNLGYFMIILLAGLKAIPPELPEAAQVDGANWFQRLVYVTVPQLASPLLFVAVTWLMGGLQMFTQSYVMTQGGPVNSTRTIVYDMYESAFLRLDIGKASAIAVLMFLAVLLLAILPRIVAAMRERSAA
ncbi:carbohydrate ABC transporter permease [Tessaracoccus aquimaris]|uniref:carbohydrate ABC transporter permease n=1 Tax=Tessaracoccus aquimaris TaxID=1332264 RepID=UPI001D059AE9|nr:sugar ABC transporter permease [Tessaracoccus aquimaris]